jgi:predicted metal-dependent hydrolase
MATRTLPGSPPIEIELRRSGRARRYSLRVSGLDGRVTLTLPVRAPEAEALAFAADKAEWLRRHLDRRPGEVRPLPGAHLLFEGRETPILPGSGRAVRYEAGALLVPGAPARAPARLKAWLVALARQRLEAASAAHGRRIGRRHHSLTLRDTRSRWGSCSSSGGLMYSWRLILAPPEVLDYVAAHEVAHLAEMNHSPAFWAVVRGLCPEYARHRAWLRAEGARLHRYRFEVE